MTIFSVVFTSLKLLNRITEFNNRGVYHLDATYKIIKHNFCLIGFGFTDLARHFYPVCYMFSSHETTVDYTRFFTEFLDIYNKASVSFKLAYMVIDASHSMANAIKKCFPDCVILMCWFHLKQNIRKHKKLIPEHLYEKTLYDITKLHECTCK